MKVLLIVPGWPASNLWGQLKFKFPPLSVLTLASSTPEDVEISVIDENLEHIPPEVGADLIGITVMTPQAKRAYQIAGDFRRKGKKVVLGGFHATFCPEEAGDHVDGVVLVSRTTKQYSAEIFWHGFCVIYSFLICDKYTF